MKTSRFFLSTLIAASAMTATAYAELTTMATMNEFVSAGTVGEGVALDTSYTSASTVYDFTGSGAIENIVNSSILDYVNGGSGYITIAGWVYADSISGNLALFSVGGQNDGFKFGIKDGTLQVTTKGKTDYNNGPGISAEEWTFVALSFALDGTSDSRYYTGTSNGGFYTKTFESWNTITAESFAIGSGNSNSDRDLFSGQIANLTIFSSDELVNNSAIASIVGDAPVIQIDTDGKLVWAGTSGSNVWNTNEDNNIWVDGETKTAFVAGSDVAFTNEEVNKTVALESGSTVTVGDVAVGVEGYSFVVDRNSTATVSGKTLTVIGGASLTIGSHESTGVTLDFENIILSGVLTYNNDSTTWRSLNLNGGTLAFYDSKDEGLIIESVTVSKKSTITSSWDNKLKIETLTGAKDLSVTGASEGGTTAFHFTVENLDGYSGELTLNNGTNGLNATLGATGETTTSGAKVAVQSGLSLNIAGTTTLDTLAFNQNGSQSSTVTVNEGSTVTLTTLNNNWGFNKITVDGALNVTGTATMTSGSLNTITGTGKVVINNLVAQNTGNYVFDVDTEVTSLRTGFLVDDRSISFKKTTSIGTVTHNVGILSFEGDTTVGRLSIASGKTVNVSGSLELTQKEGSNFAGTLNVLEGGTLTITGHDALGYSDGGLGAGEISLQGSSDAMARLVVNDSRDNNSLTFSKTLRLNGYTEVSSTIDTKDDEDESNDVKRSFNSWGGTIVASGIKNEISSDVGLRRAFTITVEDKGDLLISGIVKNGQDQTGGLEKAGLGTLTLSGVNTFNRTLTVSGVTLVAASTSALGSGAVTVNGGAALQIAVEKVDAGSIHLNTGATLVVDLADFKDVIGTADEKMLTILTGTTLTFGDVSVASGTLSNDVLTPWVSIIDQTGEFSKYVNKEWAYDGSTLSLTLSVPEPSAFGLLAGLGAMALVVSRRRRTKTAQSLR